MNRAELDLYTADLEAVERLTAAKDAYRAKPTPASKAKLEEAKRAVFALRSHWRGIREATGGGAIPTLDVKTKVRT